MNIESLLKTESYDDIARMLSNGTISEPDFADFTEELSGDEEYALFEKLRKAGYVRQVTTWQEIEEATEYHIDAIEIDAWGAISEEGIEEAIESFEADAIIEIVRGSEADKNIRAMISEAMEWQFNEFSECLQIGFYSKKEKEEMITTDEMTEKALREMLKHEESIETIGLINMYLRA